MTWYWIILILDTIKIFRPSKKTLGCLNTIKYISNHIGEVSAGIMDQSGITPNTSNQQLVNSSDDSATALLQEKQARRRENLGDVTFIEYMTVGILCFVNLINYMDRYTIAGKFFNFPLFSIFFILLLKQQQHHLYQFFIQIFNWHNLLMVLYWKIKFYYKFYT